MTASIDIETGGFNPNNNPICEIGMVIFNDNNVVLCQYNALIKPYNTLDSLLIYEPRAMEVNGLDEDVLMNHGIDIEDAMIQFCELLILFDVKNLLGHNFNKFDWPFLKKSIHDNAYRYTPIIGRIPIIDTLEIANKDNRYRKLSLKAICEKDDINYSGSHRALEDATSTMEWYVNQSNQLVF